MSPIPYIEGGLQTMKRKIFPILFILLAIAGIVLLTVEITKNNVKKDVVYITPEPTTESASPTPQIVYVTTEPTEVVSPTPQVIYVTEEPREEATPIVVYVTEEPKTDPTPIVVYVTPEPTEQSTPVYIYVTPAPTETATPEPQVIYIPVYTATDTPAPAVVTATPTPVAANPTAFIVFYYTPSPVPGNWYTNTPAPVITATLPPVITATPAPIITATPTPNVTPTPTQKPTDAPTDVPTQAPTDAPTEVPTEAPTAAPPTESPEEISDKKINKILGELSHASVAGEVLPYYGNEPKKDFNKYVNTEGINHEKLFKELKKFFVTVVAHSFDFDFQTGSTPESNLYYSLQTGKGSDGKLILTYNKDNNAIMEEILNGITNYEDANNTMLQFLIENTTSNPQNDNERLFIVSEE